MTRPWMPAACRPILPIALLLIGGVSSALGDEELPSASDQKPKPVKVPGTFEAIRISEVSPNKEHLTDLKLERVVPYGTKVSKGQALIWLETKKLSEKLRSAETDLELARLALEADEFAHQQFLKQQVLDKAKANRTRQIAQQEYDNFQKVDRERQIKQAKFSLESSEFSLESATEEHEQLEQMYKEDDLTEQSEEIVLRRAMRAMKSAAFSLERTRIQTERTIKQSIPRSDASQKDTLARAILEHENAMRGMQNDRQKRELELQRKRVKFKTQSETFQEMRAERQHVVLKSDIDGVFLYGQLLRAKLPAKTVDLKTGSSVTGKQILGTVVDPSRLQIRVDLPEERLHLVRKGVKCKVVPKAMPNVELDGIVKSVGIVPYANGKYDCVVTARGKPLTDIMPAMTCELLFVDPEGNASKDKDSKDKDSKDSDSKDKGGQSE